MRLAMIDVGGAAILALVLDDGAVPLAAVAPGAPGAMLDALAVDAEERLGWQRAAEQSRDRIALDVVRWQLPIARPGKILCLGLNYVDHAAEAGFEVPAYPTLFLRTVTSVVPHGEPLLMPDLSASFDYEAELMAVIGRRAERVTEADALGHIAGYTLFNDGSVREYQRKAGPQWTVGKNFDRSGAIGPWVVPADELPSAGKGLRIRGRLNGETVQDATTSDMVFDLARTIAIVSETMTLEPGDLIASGTPPGVGAARKPPLFMKPGDRFDVEVEGVGTLSNPVAAR